MTNYSRFSHHARRALTHAGILVHQFRHPRLDTGHLLVGIRLAKGSIGCSILEQMDFHVDQASVYLKSLTLPLEEALEHPPNDAALDACLDLAIDESTWLGHHYVGTEHLLLGITRTNVGNASDLLRLVGISPDQVRRRVRQALSEGLSEYSLQVVRRYVRLSELSRRVINAAEQLAVAFDHETVGIGHLLLVLLREKRSITATLLHAVALDESRVEQALRNREPAALDSIERILVMAVEYAQNWGDHYTGTEHLLLVITADPAGAGLLRQFNIAPEVLHRKVESYLRSRSRK